MDIDKFYKDVCELLPYKQDRDLDYRKRLNNALRKYIQIVSDNKLDDNVQKSIHVICEKLKVIVNNSLSGWQSTASIQLQNLIKGKKGLSPKISLADMIYTCEADSNFYRVRQLPSIYEVEAKELFHIPISKRGIVKTQRYSIPGYPCLYLGKSIYGCWEEMRRPPMHTCAVSRFQNKVELNFIDLSLPTKEKLKLSIYQELVPLIISCMIPVVNDSDTFKPEYIIPQLIFEWFLKNREINGKTIHGIAYTSTHLNDEFYFPDDKFINYAIPVFDVNEKHKYCKKLCSIFQLTKPTTNDIEKLKWAYPVEGWNYPEGEEHKRMFNYDISDFGNLEGRLVDTDNFPLQTIVYK